MYYSLMFAFLLIALGLGGGFWTGSLWTLMKFDFTRASREKVQRASVIIVLMVIGMSLTLTTTPMLPTLESLMFSVPAFIVGLAAERVFSWQLWRGLFGVRKHQMFVTHAMLSITVAFLTAIASLVIAVQLVPLISGVSAIFMIALQVVVYTNPYSLTRIYGMVFLIYYDYPVPLRSWGTPSLWYGVVSAFIWCLTIGFVLIFVAAG